MIIMMACLFDLDLHAEIPRHLQLNTYRSVAIYSGEHMRECAVSVNTTIVCKKYILILYIVFTQI